MSNQPSPQQPNPLQPLPSPNPDQAILGLSTNALAGLTVEKLVGNETAITMLMHYYKELVNQNNTLKNDVNTYKTYVDSYQNKKTYSKIGAVLLTLSNVFIGFGVNLITSKQIEYGWMLFIPGLIMVFAGLYFTLTDN